METMLSKSQRLSLGVVILLIVDVIWVASSELTKILYQDEQFEKPFFCTFFKTSLFALYFVLLALISPWRESCFGNANYQLVENSSEDEHYFSNGSLSDSTFVPIKAPDSEVEEDSRMVRFSKLAEVREMSAAEATEALMSRLSYTASLRVRRAKTYNKTARTSLMFCILWFIANYLFQLALEPSDVALVTLLSTTSTVFTLILATAFPSSSGDRLTLSKVVAVALCIGGAMMVKMSEISEPSYTRGILLSVCSAFFYACYLVLVKRKNDMDEKVNIMEFFGFVGLWNVILLWPLFLILNFSQLEPFEMPNRRQFLVLFVNGIVGTVISEALWLWGCFLTSTLIGTLAMTLQIPISMLLDVIIRGKVYPLNFYLGSIPMFLSLLLVAFLVKCDDADPISRIFKLAYRKVWWWRRAKIISVPADLDDEQHESLIDNNHEN